MQALYEKHRRQAKRLLEKINGKGIALIVTGENTLRIQDNVSPGQLATIRLWKASLIEVLSPTCSECRSPMTLINGGTLWFCRLGCESRKTYEND